MGTKKVKAIIERAADGGYGIYCPETEQLLNGCGATEEEAKESLRSCVRDVLTFCKEKGIDASELNNGDLEFEYVYDFSGFFQAYPMFNASELARFIGINATLMRRYKTGKKQASSEQKKRIEVGIHSLAKRLGAVTF